MKVVCIYFLLGIIIAAQSIVELDSVPSEFKTKYMYGDHDWNPLWVGNLWQYSNDNNENEIDTRYIEKDTVVNGKTYYKKVDYLEIDGNRFSMWERNDWNKYSSYMLDVNDMNDNSITDEELLLDSLEVGTTLYEYTTYRFAYNEWKDIVWFGPITARVRGPEWYEVFGDTVLVKVVEYLELFQTEYIADQYGVIKITGDFFEQTLTGARIYGSEHGNITEVENNYSLPIDFSLKQNYPNPFNPTTTIEYFVAEQTHVKISVYNSIGELIKTLVERIHFPGNYKIDFNASDLSSGVYFYTMNANDFHKAKKMMLIN